jgi:hypothetical protein
MQAFDAAGTAIKILKFKILPSNCSLEQLKEVAAAIN